MIEITDRISIPEEEISFTASRSSGPGGQNVNKVSTRVTLWFDLDNSPILSPEEKELIKRRLGSRVGKDGILRITAQQTRSQSANRDLAVERFVQLLRAALTPVPVRRKTRVSKAAKLRRLEEKRQRSTLKQERTRRVPVED